MNIIRFTLPDGWRATLWLEGGPSEAAAREWLTKLTTEPSCLSGYASLKYSASGEVFRADAPASSSMTQVVCKSSRASRWGGFLPSRARKNARRAEVLLSTGINTAQPLALLERGRESWLVTEYMQDLVDLDQFALAVLPRLKSLEAHRLKSKVIKQLAELFARLLQSGMHHRDLKASNIVLSGLTSTETGCKIVILDLDGLRTWTPRKRAAERARLTRLAASLLQYRSITRADYARFLKSYVAATSRAPQLGRNWFRELARCAFRYNSRARFRKFSKLDGYGG